MGRAPPTLRMGVATVALDLPDGVPLAGHGFAGRVGRADGTPLRARVFHVSPLGARDDPATGGVALVVADLMSGTRAVWEAACAEAGIARSSLVLVGTHTHHGPGGIYGSTLYDALASARPGARPDVVRSLAVAIAAGLRAAASSCVPVRASFGRSHLLGVFRNASPAAFARNPEAADWNADGRPGAACRDATTAALRAVDPRVDALVFRRAADGGLVGVFAVVRGHATALSHDHASYAADWPGEAADRASETLGACVAVACGAAGDENALALADELRLSQGIRLMHSVATRAAASIAAAASVAIDVGEGFGVGWDDEPTHAFPDVLAEGWSFGVAALGGAEDGRSVFHTLGLARGGQLRGPSPQGRQGRKRMALGILQPWLARRFGLAPPRSLPTCVVRIGSHALATAPGEPSVIMGDRIERAVSSALGVHTVSVLGTAVDYAGYFTTPEEYEVQEYEGASTLFGSRTGEHLVTRVCVAAGRVAAIGEPGEA